MNRRFCVVLAVSFILVKPGLAQPALDSIEHSYIEKTMQYLASDKLGGRVNYTKEQLEAAEFIKKEFESFGLVPFPGTDDYYVPFRTEISSNRKASGQIKWNGQKLADSSWFFIQHSLYSGKLKLEDFVVLEAALPLAPAIVAQQWENKQPTLIWINAPDTISIAAAMEKVNFPNGLPSADLLIVLRHDAPTSLSLADISFQKERLLYNVVGMLPGKSKPEEAIIFCAHYDHVDHAMDGTGGQVFNGANDNASGTTAVLALAKYFAQRKDNERSIIFCLFAGEEIGLLGSTAFASRVNAETIKAVINIEMIGVTNATGKNAFMLTGPEYSSLFDIMKTNLKGTGIKAKKLLSDPSNLFRRSDNYSFHLEGMVAHTIMCSNDEEPCYHQPCDDVKNMDLENMVQVIRGIAQSASTLISGADTPVRKGKN